MLGDATELGAAGGVDGSFQELACEMEEARSCEVTFFRF